MTGVDFGRVCSDCQMSNDRIHGDPGSPAVSQQPDVVDARQSDAGPWSPRAAAARLDFPIADADERQDLAGTTYSRSAPTAAIRFW